MSSKYGKHPLEKKFIKDTTGVDLDAPSKLSHEDFMRLKEGGRATVSRIEEIRKVSKQTKGKSFITLRDDAADIETLLAEVDRLTEELQVSRKLGDHQREHIDRLNETINILMERYPVGLKFCEVHKTITTRIHDKGTLYCCELHAEQERVRELEKTKAFVLSEYNELKRKTEKAEAENKRLGNRDGNAHIELVLEKDGHPFYRIPLKVVDFGVADNIYVVESDDIQTTFTENTTLRERLNPVEEVYKEWIGCPVEEMFKLGFIEEAWQAIKKAGDND